VLAGGGRSRRFGSDKARAPLAGVPLIRRVADALGPACGAVYAVAAHAGVYDDLGLTTLGDDVPGLGPLGGLATALRHRRKLHGEGWLVLASCDGVGAHAGLIERLVAHQTRSRATVFRHARWEPMPGLYHTAALPAVEGQLQRDQRAMWRLLEAIDAEAVPWPGEAGGLAQVNTPDDLARQTR